LESRTFATNECIELLAWTELFRLQFVAEILLRELCDSTAYVDLLTDAGADGL
jgi:hypothetical protein